jgi:hypothetical protein
MSPVDNGTSNRAPDSSTRKADGSATQGALAPSSYTPGPRRPSTSETTKKIKNGTKRTLAIQAASPAMPLKPETPAMIATIRKMTAYLRILYPLAQMVGAWNGGFGSIMDGVLPMLDGLECPHVHV